MAIDTKIAASGVGLTQSAGPRKINLAGGKGEESFADMVASAAKDAVATGHKGEGTSMQGIAKQADLVDVVTAVSNAELTLQTVVTVRDRVIQAYQDIIRMPI
ncbi:MAG: flagellar hook-basal body complex protein FliE [Alphaproteobacteria bacterium]|nr:flagellar hook-basal body complex protein FliE [Alphaproteobacteria bacterium]